MEIYLLKIKSWLTLFICLMWWNAAHVLNTWKRGRTKQRHLQQWTQNEAQKPENAERRALCSISMWLLLFISDAVRQLSYIYFHDCLKIMAHGSKNINKCCSTPVASALLSNLTLKVLTYDQSGRRPSSQVYKCT